MNNKENQAVEWKESWRDDYLRWVCGFANGRGGRLIIGKSDKGKAVGIGTASKLLEDLPNKIRDLLGIVAEVNLLQENGRELLEIHVPAYSNPISYRGHYYQRSGSTLQELKGAALDRFLLRSQGRTWDAVPVPGVRVADLSASHIQRFRDMASESGRLEPADLSMPDTGLLEKLKLTEGNYLKRAAVLLFHQDPEQFITGAFVKIGFFRSESDLAYHDEVHGGLFSQVKNTVDFLRTKYMNAAIAYKDIQRVEHFPVPYAALREVVLNALVHRDYAVPAPIQIRVYADKLKISNPAALPEGWTLEKLLGEHSSHPFNPDVANVFFRAGEIEAWGRGIERIFSACRNADSPKPQVRLSGNDLWFEFPFSPVYLDRVAGGTKGKAPVKTPGKTSGKTSGKTGVKTGVKIGVKLPDLIVAAMRQDPNVTYVQLAQNLGKAESTIADAVNRLKEDGRIKRVGPAKGGHWEVREAT